MSKESTLSVTFNGIFYSCVSSVEEENHSCELFMSFECDRHCRNIGECTYDYAYEARRTFAKCRSL